MKIIRKRNVCCVYCHENFTCLDGWLVSQGAMVIQPTEKSRGVELLFIDDIMEVPLLVFVVVLFVTGACVLSTQQQQQQQNVVISYVCSGLKHRVHG